jgi:hypothetical protein
MVLNFFHFVLIFTELWQDLSYFVHKANTQSEVFCGGG